MRSKKVRKQSQHVRRVKTKKGGRKKILVNPGNIKAKKVKKKFRVTTPRSREKLLSERVNKENEVILKVNYLLDEADALEKFYPEDAERFRKRAAELEDKWNVEVKRSSLNRPVIVLGKNVKKSMKGSKDKKNEIIHGGGDASLIDVALSAAHGDVEKINSFYKDKEENVKSADEIIGRKKKPDYAPKDVNKYLECNHVVTDKNGFDPMNGVKNLPVRGSSVFCSKCGAMREIVDFEVDDY